MTQIQNSPTAEKAKAGWSLSYCCLLLLPCPHFLFDLPGTRLHGPLQAVQRLARKHGAALPSLRCEFFEGSCWLVVSVGFIVDSPGRHGAICILNKRKYEKGHLGYSTDLLFSYLPWF